MKMLGKSAGIAIAALGLSTQASAQDMRAASEKVVACQAVEESIERLACFESAAAELSSLLTAPVQQATAAPQAPAALAPAATASQAEQALVEASTATAAPIQQAAVETDASSEPSRSVLPAWIPRVSFGERKDVEKEPDQFETTLTRIQRNNLGRHFFTTAEGHVWKQKGLDKIRAPSTLPTPVVLDKNIMGGIQIKILETKENYPVTRVE